MSLKLLHKGVILFVLPFSLQVGLLCGYLVMQKQASDISKQQMQQAQILVEISSLVEEFGQAWSVIIGREVAPSAIPRKDQTADQYKAAIDQHYDRLKELARYDPSIAELLPAVHEFAEQQYRIQKDLELSTDPGGTGKLLVIYSKVRETKSLFLKSSRALCFLRGAMESRQARLKSTIEEVERKESKLKATMLAMLILQIVLTVVLMIIFLKDIGKRLNVLMSSAKELPTGRLSRPLLTGSDEIAYLDKTLHEAAESLANSAQKRQFLLNMITHDIRSPLTSSKIVLEKLLADPELSEQSSSAGADLQRNMQYVFTLVEDLLSIEKLENGVIELRLEEVALKEIFEASIAAISAQADFKGVTIEERNDDCLVICDRYRLEQVLINLISNAIKHSPEGGTIVVRTNKVEESLVVEIQDQGPGLSPVDCSRVFEKFFQADAEHCENSQGFGLGLALCKLLVRQHGGEVGVDSVLGHGSTFWFTLPLE